MELRAELHCHSQHSPCSQMSLEQLIEQCCKKEISIVALTDHNTTIGAFELQKQAPDWLTVIIGEEVHSREGDVIGLFLTENIAPEQPIEETIKQIKSQGGLVLLPHPMDRLRKSAVGPEVAERVKNSLDFISIFNSRCLFNADNKKAAGFAKANHIPSYVESDAHSTAEVGRALNVIPPYKNPEEFKESLKQATFITRASGPVAHLRSKYNRLFK